MNFKVTTDYDDRARGTRCNAALWMKYSAIKKWNTNQMEGLKENERYRDFVKDKVKKML